MGDRMRTEMKTCNILGTNIAVTNMTETIRYIENHIGELRGDYICVSNVHTTVTGYEDRSYQEIQNSAAAALPDGKPLSLYSKKHGYPEAERVTGPDLMGELFQRDNGLRHYFYGGKEETIKMLSEKLPAQYQNLIIAGMESPPFRPLSGEEDAAAVKRINEARPDIIWVGLGAPKQERWMYEHRNKVNGVMIGVGAGFDYYAGEIRRAPLWMQRLSLEWLYRLLQDPGRLLKRYLVTNFKFLWLTLGKGR